MFASPNNNPLRAGLVRKGISRPAQVKAGKKPQAAAASQRPMSADSPPQKESAVNHAVLKFSGQLRTPAQSAQMGEARTG
jgi:hypothetical protein